MSKGSQHTPAHIGPSFDISLRQSSLYGTAREIVERVPTELVHSTMHCMNGE